MRTSQQHSDNTRRPVRRRNLTLGIAMVVVGALLLTIVSGYFAYATSARSQLGDLNYVVAAQSAQSTLANPSAPAGASFASSSSSSTMSSAPLLSNPVVAPAQGTTTGASVTTSSGSAAVNLPVNAGSQAGAVSPAQSSNHTGPTGPTSPASPANQEESTLPPSSYTALYPASHIHPKFWAQPLWAGGEPYVYNPDGGGSGLPDGFRAVSAVDDALLRGSGSATTRIAIPLIDVDSETKELSILNLGDSRAYETPKNLVGHIPQSPNPGERGNAWYFGHLESPIRGEGNVFQRLPEIPDLLRDGDDVFVELENEDGSIFLYKITRTEVLHQDELELYGADVAQLTLVACVPRLVYDHRIVVTAELVGIKYAPGVVH
ncbi:MAG: sortase [Chloroflexi bacterium]|nr:sortase [Chloroflexota bacterium]